MEGLILLAIFIWIIKFIFKAIERSDRKDYYRNDYLKSDDWKRKRSVVLGRDNYKCTICGAKATQVHHKRYASKNIGKEPIDWLDSLCKSCHEQKHH